MKSFAGKLIIIVVSLFICTSAFAQEDELEKTRFGITPRIWFSFVDLAAEDEGSTETFLLPLFGLTISVTPKSMPNTNFLLTGYFGEGEGDHVVTFQPAPFNEGELEAERTDLELLVRYNVPEKNISLFAGPRYIIFNEKESVPGYTAETDTDLLVGEFGVGMAASLSEDGRHRLFSNFAFGLGYQQWDFRDTDGFSSSGSYFSPTIDLNLGYQYVTSTATNFSIRYRLFAIIAEAEVLDGFEQSKLDTLHGPEITFTITF